MTPRYVDKIPSQIPAWRVLVHNHVRPAQPIGMHGFRAWLQDPGEKPQIERCDCDWAPALAEHYRVVRLGEESSR